MDELADLQRSTPARIGVGRAGTRPLTHTMLKMRLDHAAAIDSVYGRVSAETLAGVGLFTVRTQSGDKELYLKRPELGRLLHPDDTARLVSSCVAGAQVQIVVSDGLSAESVEANVPVLLPALTEALHRRQLLTGTTFYVEGGRVGLMNAIGDLLQPEVIVLLIGERPGLVTAESLSAYVGYLPRSGRTDADRKVISNIHRGGTPPQDAGEVIAGMVERMIVQKTSGMNLV
ncbi:ethanolamine ammonia-lyase subunit EutC [Paenibacillus swuensis]|uniref:ethanolamine ammonia-lyase subunit EutC n=1 Tax=Paenibacillus swuensis TaxID=1178515 RepID=UPI000B0B2320|nr:ethanolamine ammonia-lyase subunit EutC [Paenibacillus swuensis]